MNGLVKLALALGFGGALASLAARAAPAGDAAKGAEVFEDRCVMCHAPAGGSQGPSLVGVVGRKAGSVPGFNYTQALKSSGLTWTPAELDRWLQGPSKLVPGTAMKVIISNPDDRRNLIAYLASRRR